MAEKKGTLSINSDNIFPIIKKWLYSDHDIFFRELISNGCDAITKLKKLDMMGEYNFPEGHKNKVDVILDPEKKTLKFIDTGLGMTADEVEKYITQIAFSGATQFLEQYKDKTEGDQIIGHFGLGFYSAFMVADEVTIDTLSYKEGQRVLQGAIKMLRQDRLQSIIDQGGFSTARHPCHTDKFSQWKLHIHIFQVVSPRTLQP